MKSASFKTFGRVSVMDMDLDDVTSVQEYQQKVDQ